MQYAETLPLADKEVVLSFDDGPLPKHSNEVLDILASECVKATFFVIGRMAREYPDGVRKLRDAGHSIGTHSQNHPLRMNRMPIDEARREIEDGIAATTAALGGDASAVAPFFRIPGLLRAEVVEDYLVERGIQTWSADFPADDWRRVSPRRVHDLAMSRIAAKGRGILLLHDIQPRTVAALPAILRDLKAGGYKIVHVIPATATTPKTPTEPSEWQMHPVSEYVAILRWPAVPDFAFAPGDMLPIPEAPQLGLGDGALLMFPKSFDRVRRLARGQIPPPVDTPWPKTAAVAVSGVATRLPVPAAAVFERAETKASTIKPDDAIRRAIPRVVSIEASAAARPIPQRPAGHDVRASRDSPFTLK